MFKWKAEYSVNIISIDEQHKKLFEIGSKIFDISELDDRYDHYDEIIAVLEELKDYTVYHFDYEEKLLGKYNYESLEDQHFEHEFFIKKIQRLGRKDIEGKQNETALEIYSFVVDWIESHILKRDMKYKNFMNNQGVFR